MDKASPIGGDQQQQHWSCKASPAFQSAAMRAAHGHEHYQPSLQSARGTLGGTPNPKDVDERASLTATTAVRAPHASVVHAARGERDEGGGLPMAFTFDQSPIGLKLHWEGESPHKSDAGSEGVGAVRVRAVTEGGKAQLLGITPGWEVVRVNQEPVAQLSENALMHHLHKVRPLTLWLVPPPPYIAFVFDAGPTGLSLHWEKDEDADSQSTAPIGVVRVQSIKQGGLADTLGVRAGWELMQIDGTRVANLGEEDFIDLLTDRPATLFFLPSTARIQAAAKRLSTMADMLGGHANNVPDSYSGALVAFKFDEHPTGLKLGWEQSCAIASRQPCMQSGQIDCHPDTLLSVAQANSGELHDAPNTHSRVRAHAIAERPPCVSHLLLREVKHRLTASLVGGSS